MFTNFNQALEDIDNKSIEELKVINLLIALKTIEEVINVKQEEK